ncbi:uncharacterized protein MYCFIDRAFT_145931 [Pseudocercospora fijiensis CIRAD86]|uniref:WLM domain-containing protein n=1 Tax=Pseudocercospora fijiensis (strain CIRAD86) TaxID=383855 RepID=M2ZEQ4_PSEFD|nr:uncharacterized protein MYCFIDRAFT_145931 [Pseudocercospora fijiensis CIRAD86]EME77609.1 hypothetical protein MYCFIDRAFT_145931 [Pseudocercospora fijiensis CIRAD86]
MPLGFERLNERQQRPNQLINFIKPLEGPDKATAEEFLSRIAAQCYPVMKKHHISVMALEEYAPNPEFLGRNFNAGEVIQLVLKDKAGRWLSMKFVQMVMMHELAHCKQMNHSRFFWNVRNEYAKQMEELWREQYMGEGMWGRGRGLATGSFVNAAPPDQSLIPEHLCGGSYRRRGRKRKRGAQGDEDNTKLSYAERQQQRIQRKFGKHGEGESLGEDELVRGALSTMNGGKRAAGKPRVANSKRGRDLRANAALLRFEAAKNQQKKEQTPDLVEDLDSETDSEWEADSAAGSEDRSVVISDGHGHDLVKVCGDGEDDEEGAGREMDELRMLSKNPTAKKKHVVDLDAETESESEQAPSNPREKPDTVSRSSKAAAPPARGEEGHEDSETEDDPLQEIVPSNTASLPDEPTPSSACPICSLENAPNSVTCIACSHVLCPKLMPNHWRCKSDLCKGSKYINAGDAGRCGLCGSQKPKPALSSAATERPVGITRAEVLRWD